MAMNDQDYERYWRRMQNLQARQAPAAQLQGYQGYQSPVTQPTAGLQTMAGQQSTAGQQTTGAPSAEVNQARLEAETQDWANKLREYQQRPQQQNPRRWTTTDAYGRVWDNEIRSWGGMPKAEVDQARMEAENAYAAQTSGNSPDDVFKYGRVDTRPWMQNAYARTPYQQVLDDYDNASTYQTGYQGAPRQTNYLPQQSYAPRNSYGGMGQTAYAPRQSSGAPMPNRGNTGSTAWGMPSQYPMRQGEQAQYTPLPDRSPGQAQYTPYSSSGMNRKMNYRGR